MFSQNARKVALVLLPVFTLAGVAYSHSQANADSVEDGLATKRVDSFEAMLMITDDPEGLFEAWARQPSPDYGPNISQVSTAHRGEVIMAFVVFSGCAEDSLGNCDVEVHYTAYYPDNSVYGKHSGALWVGLPDPGKGSLQLSEGNLGLKFESDDPFGNYRISADIIDKVSGTEFSLHTEITVVVLEK